MKISNIDMKYYFGEPLIDLNNFSELFLTCLMFDDGVLDLDNYYVKGKLPFDYENKIYEYIKELTNISEISDLIDLDLYYNNTNAWFRKLNRSLNSYIYKNQKFVKIDDDCDINNSIITMPLKYAINVLKKYDNDIKSKMLNLTTDINREKLTDLERLERAINMIGVVPEKTKMKV